MTEGVSQPAARGSRLDRFLRLFTDVRPGEGLTAVLLAVNVALVLGAYYVIRPLRESFLLAEYSPEVKSYLQVANVLALAVIVPLYGKLTDRFPRRRLINVVTYVFVALLGVFFLMGVAGLPLGIVFFVYGSIFAVMVVTQFWSFANDIYTREEGERLFPIVAFGASLGAAVGATFVGQLIEPFGLYVPMLLSGGVLLAQLQITNYVDNRERALREAHLPDIKTTATIAASGLFKAPTTIEELEELAEQERLIFEARQKGEPVPEPEASSGESAFALVLRTRYLLLIAVLIMFLNWVNTNGEYILGRFVVDAAAQAVAEGTTTLTQGEFIGRFYANFYAVMNIVGLLIQLFVTSRVVKYLGVHIGVMMLPLLAFGAYGLIALFPVLTAVRWAKTAENATDYSLNNAVRQMLFLPTTREQKYKAKQVSDSFFHRAGDVLSAATVFIGTTVLALTTSGLAFFNMALVVIWLVVAVAVGREYRELVRSGRPPRPRGGRRAAHPFEDIAVDGSAS